MLLYEYFHTLKKLKAYSQYEIKYKIMTDNKKSLDIKGAIEENS